MEGCESPGEFVRDSGAAEFSEGVLRVWTARVDDREGVGHVGDVCRWIVVVGDDEVDAELFGFGCGVDGGDSAVDGDDDLCSGLCECFDCRFVEAVAFFDAVGDVGGDLCVWSDDSQHVDEDRGGGDAIDIVISEDDDGFIVGDGVEDALSGFIEVGDQRRVVESGEGRGEECFGGLSVVEVACGEDAVNEGEGGVGEGSGGVPVSGEASGGGSWLLELGGHELESSKVAGSGHRGQGWKDTL